MAEELLIDTDVLMKLVGYRMADHAVGIAEAADMVPSMLGAARFMLANHVARSRRIADRPAAAAHLGAILPQLTELEPTQEETALAAEIEAAAVAADLAVDGGESQLAAMMAMRGGSLLLTGDKRAVAALGALGRDLPPNRVACFEQMLRSLVDVLGPGCVRAAVCCEPALDKAVTLACSCASTAEVDPRDGLASYVENLRSLAPTLLKQGPGIVGS
ncbi:hypothetical protein SR41_16645 [Sphingomonas melonis]|uniref:PIN domain-containing protein n=1 Tax=Sphingomonas melonis TaxID=152682 RepID=A0A0D1M5A9_9SPHN|nr:hypothetical protein [Sphingomonas melonis]KIU26007.1 hypothetical protein SR41_16645 [Sphingomonas melonis]